MSLSRCVFYVRVLLCNIASLRGLSALLSSFGSLWLLVEIANYFFHETVLPELIESSWWVFLLVGLGIAVWICRPVLIVSARLRNRDVQIEIVIGNVFTFEGAIVVGSNSTFDTKISKDLISEKSVQGQFTEKYYAEEKFLDAELNHGLSGYGFEELDSVRLGKTKRYPLGTVVKLNPKNRIGYFLAIANINEHGVASSTFDALKDCLAELWVFIGDRGVKGSLVVPVLGTGATRLTTTRQEVVHEIIKSFVAACSERTFCDKLTIVVSESDAIEHALNLDRLGAYLNHVCQYTEFSNNSNGSYGTPVL